jgi:hypothetical protein
MAWQAEATRGRGEKRSAISNITSDPEADRWLFVISYSLIVIEQKKTKRTKGKAETLKR